jgi:hypothetical protein
MNQKTNYFYKLFDRTSTEPNLTFPNLSTSDNAHQRSLSDIEPDRLNLNVSLVIFKWTFWLGLILLSSLYFPQNDSFNRLFELSNLSLLAWSIGTIEPDLVIRFGFPKNRRTVTAIYLTIAIVYRVFCSF